jgi:hypothetical protein
MIRFVRAISGGRGIFRGIAILAIGASPMATANAGAGPLGVWGAQNAVLTIGSSKSRIEWGAAEATINGPIKPDAKGRFKTTGHYLAYTPGPDRVDIAPARRDAHIEGRVVGDIIEMTMHIAGDKTTQRYTFKKGQRSKLIRML